MTLVITLGNSKQTIQLSDRRITSSGHLVNDEFNKAGILNCRNARLSYGFSGLAKFSNFNTSNWLIKTLDKCGDSKVDANSIINRFCEKATNDFNSLSELKGLPLGSKKLSIIFTGYLYTPEGIRIVQCIVTNFQDFDTKVDNKYERDVFHATYLSSPAFSMEDPFDREFTFIQRIGQWQSFGTREEQILRDLLEKDVPPEHIIAKACKIIRACADKAVVGKTIGSQISSIIVPCDLKEDYKCSYHSNVRNHKIYAPDMIDTTQESNLLIFGLCLSPE